MLELAAVRAGLSTGPRRWVVGLGFVLPFMSMISIGLGLSSGLGAGPWLQSLALAPYGIAWAMLEALTALRGIPTTTNSTAGVPTEATA